MLKTENLSFAYQGENKLSFPDINCGAGQNWLLIGPSGCGKTTLLHLIGGLRKPQNGKVHIANKDISTLSSSQLDLFRGQNVGIVFQQSHFVKALTVEENLMLAQQLARKPISKDRIDTLLKRLKLEHKKNSKPDRLSVGEQQRVAIVRALLNKPKVILADEPTSALDDNNCQEVITLLKAAAEEEKATLIVVTHDNRLKELFPNQIILQQLR